MRGKVRENTVLIGYKLIGAAWHFFDENATAAIWELNMGTQINFLVLVQYLVGNKIVKWPVNPAAAAEAPFTRNSPSTDNGRTQNDNLHKTTIYRILLPTIMSADVQEYNNKLTAKLEWIRLEKKCV